MINKILTCEQFPSNSNVLNGKKIVSERKRSRENIKILHEKRGLYQKLIEFFFRKIFH